MTSSCTVGKMDAQLTKGEACSTSVLVLCLPGGGYKGFWAYIPMYSCSPRASEQTSEVVSEQWCQRGTDKAQIPPCPSGAKEHPVP